MSAGFACLVVADESPEFPTALSYAANMAKAGGWRLIMLHVIEPSEPAPWVTVSEEMKREAWQNAENLLERFAAEVWAECGVTTEKMIVEGEVRPEIRKYIDADANVKLLVLAAAPGGAPGPLVSAIAKGHGFGQRGVPVMIVPAGLTKEDARALSERAPPA
ncbi:MAG: universal stress protein [Caulobacterales bacterium]